MVTALICLLFAPASSAQTADREIVRLAANLYQVRDGAQHTVFIVTADGIILADPLGTSTAGWLQAEFEKRFPDKLVRLVVVSTDLYTRIEGASLFNDTAVVVGQSKIGEAVRRAWQDLPGSLIPFDRNASHTLEPVELTSHPDAAALMARDRDGDGVLRPSEVNSSVTIVEREFERSDRLNANVTVLAPAAGAPQLSVVWFAEERIAFAAAIPGLLARPVRLNQPNATDAVAWARAVAALDFDVLITGDGQRVSHADIEALRKYLDALFADVAAGYEAGKSVDQLQRSVTLDAFAAAPFYPSRRAHIAELFDGVRIVTADLYGFASGRYVLPDSAYSAGYSLSRRPVVPVGTVGLRVSGRMLGLAGEFASGPQEMIARSSAYYDERIAVRDSRVSGLIRIGGVSTALVAGLSSTTTDARGEYIARATTGALGGRHPIASRRRGYGVTVGGEATVRISTNAAFLMTLRVTGAVSPARGVAPVRNLDVQVGAGLSIRTHRRFRTPN